MTNSSWESKFSSKIYHQSIGQVIQLSINSQASGSHGDRVYFMVPAHLVRESLSLRHFECGTKLRGWVSSITSRFWDTTPKFSHAQTGNNFLVYAVHPVYPVKTERMEFVPKNVVLSNKSILWLHFQSVIVNQRGCLGTRMCPVWHSSDKSKFKWPLCL